ncbi:MAG: peptide chain release factor 3 [Planctomycetota bacterium]|nr:peptide chain release factor 3 [Planctomycetota bacterium]
MSDSDQPSQGHLRNEIARRRTFAIISHPDAGKTTLTEKLLLYSGMLRTAGMVGARKGNAASSDWMGMEQERGISITASAMQFPYKDVIVNVLDTPGHQDFSEDTYRTLTAADSVIMVIDAAKGVEDQTRKLFEACRIRRIPVMTFVNKFDLPTRDPLDLMAEVEEVLGIQASARNWPVGSGREFCGVIDRDTNIIELYTKTAAAGAARPEVEHIGMADAAAHPRIGESLAAQLHDELELLKEAGNPYTREAYLAGEVSPVFFGSAFTNFGVEPLFDSLIKVAPCPSERKATTSKGEDIIVEPDETKFAAFVFKLQANMNPKHRDCVAFLRVNSGVYRKELSVKHQRSGKKFAMPSPHSLVVNERSTVVEAYPGDIIGIISKGQFAIGDTILEKGDYQFEPLPRFQPELFARVRPSDLGKQKGFQKGIAQLGAEGAVQLLYDWRNPQGEPIVAAVGRLQFEVLQYRMEDEYGVKTMVDMLPYSCSAWLEGDYETFDKPTTARLVQDADDRPLLLFGNRWEKDYAAKNNPDHKLLDIY